jgi:hypothetical protein
MVVADACGQDTSKKVQVSSTFHVPHIHPLPSVQGKRFGVIKKVVGPQVHLLLFQNLLFFHGFAVLRSMGFMDMTTGGRHEAFPQTAFLRIIHDHRELFNVFKGTNGTGCCLTHRKYTLSVEFPEKVESSHHFNYV